MFRMGYKFEELLIITKTMKLKYKTRIFFYLREVPLKTNKYTLNK